MSVRALLDIKIDDRSTCYLVCRKTIQMTNICVLYAQVAFDDPIHSASYSLPMTLIFTGL